MGSEPSAATLDGQRAPRPRAVLHRHRRRAPFRYTPGSPSVPPAHRTGGRADHALGLRAAHQLAQLGAAQQPRAGMAGPARLAGAGRGGRGDRRLPDRRRHPVAAPSAKAAATPAARRGRTRLHASDRGSGESRWRRSYRRLGRDPRRMAAAPLARDAARAALRAHGAMSCSMERRGPLTRSQAAGRGRRRLPPGSI
jgi:hypothetical protein